MNHTIKSFDEFLVNSRRKIQNYTTNCHIKLQDFPDGKILKVNRRNNSVHYRVYQKDQGVHFEIELKHRKTKLIQDYLFSNQFDTFEHQLVIQYFKYSAQILCLNSPYTDWIVDFQRRRHPMVRLDSHSLVLNYIENQIITNQIEVEIPFTRF